jgi:hypothetical protein
VELQLLRGLVRDLPRSLPTALVASSIPFANALAEQLPGAAVRDPVALQQLDDLVLRLLVGGAVLLQVLLELAERVVHPLLICARVAS